MSRRDRPASEAPFSDTTPWSGCSTPLSSLSSVVLPQPFGPSSPVSDPRSTVTLTSSSVNDRAAAAAGRVAVRELRRVQHAPLLSGCDRRAPDRLPSSRRGTRGRGRRSRSGSRTAARRRRRCGIRRARRRGRRRRPSMSASRSSVSRRPSQDGSSTPSRTVTMRASAPVCDEFAIERVGGLAPERLDGNQSFRCAHALGELAVRLVHDVAEDHVRDPECPRVGERAAIAVLVGRPRAAARAERETQPMRLRLDESPAGVRATGFACRPRRTS